MKQASWFRRALRIAVAVCAGVVFSPGSGAAQGRLATTLDALDEHPFFFHGQEVILVTEAVGERVLTWLVDEEDRTRLLVLDVPTPPDGVRDRLEVIGRFYDVGRLDEGDQRLDGLPIRQIAQELLRKNWPGIGELPVIVASSSRPAPAPSGTTTLRSIVLDPDRYVDRGVTVIGRFRGRNLYGDLPEAPDESRWDFVLRSADAAAWIVGREPKGDGFELDVMARMDTGRWLEVTGAVRVEDGMVLVEAGALALAEPVADRQPAAVVEAEEMRLPPPEVIFSAPLADDVDVPQDSTVRVQFSRDMDPDSFEGQVRVAYALPGGAAIDADADEILFELAYRGRNRVLEIRFERELERFRSVTVELGDGVTANDGTPMPPWRLSFFVGG